MRVKDEIDLKEIKVFISSRESELENEREICEKVLGDLLPYIQIIPIRSEKFCADNDIDKHIKELRNSDLIVSLLRKTKKDVIEDEIEEVLMQLKPLLVFARKDVNISKELQELIDYLKPFLRIRYFSS